MGGASNEPSASNSMGDKNLKCVVQHHCTDLIEVFKQNLVHFANEFWSCNVITGAAKDNLLDPSKGGADLRASNLVSSICNTLSSLRNIRAQSVHMLFLLSILEKADELTLATNMRIQVAQMGIDLPPPYGTPVSDHDINEREFHDDYVYGVDPVYESRKRGSIVPPRTRQLTDLSYRSRKLNILCYVKFLDVSLYVVLTVSVLLIVMLTISYSKF